MLWLENDECRIYGKDIYLELDNFKNLCRKCNVDVSDRLLEAYESHGLLFPLYRIIRPKEYLQQLFQQHYGPDRFKNVIQVLDQYGNLLVFENDELTRWCYSIFSEFNQALNEGHPLDRAYKKHEFFIQQPSRETFRKWDEYKTSLEISVDGNSVKNTVSLARHFYSPWQIYLVEEANYRYTRKINSLIRFTDDEKYIFTEQTRKLPLAKWEDYFKSLWEYRFKENLLLTKALENVNGNILEGNESKQFYDDCKTIASEIYAKYSYQLWIKLLKTLCELFFDYHQREKVRLSQCLKKDIRIVIDILLHGSGKTYSDITNDVGMRLGGKTFSYVSPLERIYPEYESYLKREVIPLLESVLSDYNKDFPCYLKLNANAINEIIEYSFKKGNETFLVSIIGITKEYFSPSYFGYEGLWSHVRSLAAAVESLVKHISKQKDFRGAIVNISTGDFDFCCQKLEKRCQRTNMDVHSYADLKCFLIALTAIRFQRCGKDLSWMKYIIKAYLIRNYVAHHTQLDSELFGRIFIKLYRSLLFLVFWAWKVKQQP